MGSFWTWNFYLLWKEEKFLCYLLILFRTLCFSFSYFLCCSCSWRTFREGKINLDILFPLTLIYFCSNSLEVFREVEMLLISDSEMCWTLLLYFCTGSSVLSLLILLRHFFKAESNIFLSQSRNKLSRRRTVSFWISKSLHSETVFDSAVPSVPRPSFDCDECSGIRRTDRWSFAVCRRCAQFLVRTRSRTSASKLQNFCTAFRYKMWYILETALAQGVTAHNFNDPSDVLVLLEELTAIVMNVLGVCGLHILR